MRVFNPDPLQLRDYALLSRFRKTHLDLGGRGSNGRSFPFPLQDVAFAEKLPVDNKKHFLHFNARSGNIEWNPVESLENFH